MTSSRNKDWKKIRSIYYAYAVKAGFRNEADDFAQYALIRELKDNNYRTDLLFIDYLRSTRGDRRKEKTASFRYRLNKATFNMGDSVIHGSNEIDLSEFDFRETIKEYNLLYYGTEEEHERGQIIEGFLNNGLSLKKIAKILGEKNYELEDFMKRYKTIKRAQQRALYIIEAIAKGDLLKEIATELGVSDGRISQILKKIKAVVEKENQKKEMLEQHLSNQLPPK